MKKLLLLLLILTSCTTATEKIFVANEESGTITVIDASTLEVIDTITLTTEHDGARLSFAPHNIQSVGDLVLVTANVGGYAHDDHGAMPSVEAHGDEGNELPDHPDQLIVIDARTHKIVHFVRLPENTGGAGGFREGLQRAIEAGFDWIWLMDDDLVAAPEALEALVRQKDRLSPRYGRGVLLNSLVLSKDRRDGDTLTFPLQELSKSGRPRIRVYHWRLSEVRSQIKDGLYRWACPFNGTFISSEAVAGIGLPNKDFYIKGDEKDFLWRAARKVPLFTVVDSRVFHPEPRPGVFDWKQYYGIRNMFVINKYFSFTRLRNLRLIVRSLALGLRHGRRGTLLVLRAIRDGLTGRLGRRDDVRTWLNG